MAEDGWRPSGKKSRKNPSTTSAYQHPNSGRDVQIPSSASSKPLIAPVSILQIDDMYKWSKDIDAMIGEKNLNLWHVLPCAEKCENYADKYLQPAELNDSSVRRFFSSPEIGAGIAMFVPGKVPCWEKFGVHRIMQINLHFCNTHNRNDKSGAALVDLVQSDILAFHWLRFAHKFVELLKNKSFGPFLYGVRMIIARDKYVMNKRQTQEDFYKIFLELWYMPEEEILPGAPSSHYQAQAAMEELIYANCVDLAKLESKYVPVGEPNIFSRHFLCKPDGSRVSDDQQ